MGKHVLGEKLLLLYIQDALISPHNYARNKNHCYEYKNLPKNSYLNAAQFSRKNQKQKFDITNFLTVFNALHIAILITEYVITMH